MYAPEVAGPDDDFAYQAWNQAQCVLCRFPIGPLWRASSLATCLSISACTDLLRYQVHAVLVAREQLSKV